ncbi:hypothetical protein NQ318_019814 [Aromia moschata]|uniref:Uncharacterized protein n=1 Tax=Aromia moschata TaxID=1265417 RepID=A0AAV8YLV7_9CUCU|nr:hypothetical protein NQ318_019814 [Aromia moschata]
MITSISRIKVCRELQYPPTCPDLILIPFRVVRAHIIRELQWPPSCPDLILMYFKVGRGKNVFNSGSRNSKGRYLGDWKLRSYTRKRRSTLIAGPVADVQATHGHHVGLLVLEPVAVRALRAIFPILQHPVVGQLLVDLLHPLDVHAAGHRVVHHRQRVVLAHDALRRPLDVLGGGPRLVDVLRRHVLQHRQVIQIYFEEFLTFIPSSQESQRSPRVKKHATACLARWWIQPSCLSCVIMASIQGKPNSLVERQPKRRYGDRPVCDGSSDWGVILGRPNDATHAFRSRWRSRRASDSVSPPCQTGGVKPVGKKEQFVFEFISAASRLPSVSKPSSSSVGTPYRSSWSSDSGVVAPFSAVALTGSSGCGGGPMHATTARNWWYVSGAVPPLRSMMCSRW